MSGEGGQKVSRKRSDDLNGVRAKKRTLRAKEAPGAPKRRSLTPISTAVIPVRQSAELVLAPAVPNDFDTPARLVHSLDALHLKDTWLGLVPQRLGHNSAVDDASKALVHACESGPRPYCTKRGYCFEAYNRAIASLQECMRDPQWRLSDDALFAIAVLAFFEKAIGEDEKTSFSHREGIEAILVSRPVPREDSEVTAAMLYQARDRMFCVPVIRGIASPFDTPHLRDQEPIARHNLSAAFQRLRYIGNRVFVRLPRVIALVRTVREDKTQSYTLQRAVSSAKDLLDFLDEEAESRALHQVTVVKTTDSHDSMVSSWSFEYKHVGELKAAMLYWEMHIFLTRLCLKLHSLSPNDSPFNASKLRTDNVRMVTNLLMSWQYAMSRSRTGTLGFTQTLILALWGALSDVENYRGVARGLLRLWMLRRFPESMRGWPSDLESADMDEAADIFAGGPRRGFMINSHAALLY